MPLELSICISTFNRGEYIGGTLQSIISQATDAVEIVIVDGGSTDQTEAVVRDWQQRFPRLRYQRQAKNGGFDVDLAAALDLGQGRYLWMYSDDDPMKPGAVQRVLSVLDDGYSLIIVNAEVRNRDLSRVLTRRKLAVESDRVYSPAEFDELVADTADYLTYVGGIVFRRDLWQARDASRWFGSMFVHTGVIFQEPLPGPTLVIAEPKVIIRYGQAMWTARGFNIWMYGWPDVIWSLPISDEAKRRIVAREPWRQLSNLALHRAMGSYSAEVYRDKLASRLSGWRKLMAMLISHTPAKLLNAFLTVFVVVVLRRASTTLVDLRNSRFAPLRSA